MIPLKSAVVAVPIGALSLSALGERIILVAAVLTAVTFIWRQAVKPIVTGAKRMSDTYELAQQHLPELAKLLPELAEHVANIDERVGELERVGEIVDLARDEHVRAMKDALEKVRSIDPPQ